MERHSVGVVGVVGVVGKFISVVIFSMGLLACGIKGDPQPPISSSEELLRDKTSKVMPPSTDVKEDEEGEENEEGEEKQTKTKKKEAVQ